jgi:hypothetical protein
MPAPGALNDPFSDARFRLFGSRRFAYLYGSDNDDRATSDPENDTRGTDILRLNDLRIPFDLHQLRRNSLRQVSRGAFDGYDCIINGVTNPDTNPLVLGVMSRLLKGFKGQVINHPDAVLRSGRDQISRRLRDIPNVVAPPAVRIATSSPKAALRMARDAGVTFPAILRRAGAHRGTAISLLPSPEELTARLEPRAAYYLISFVNFQSPDGLFRKYRFFFIGDRILVRHFYVADHWNVHRDRRERLEAVLPGVVEEERQAVNGGVEALPGHLVTALEAIRHGVGLDFFGLDCAIGREGKLILFEANASMNFYHASLENPAYEYLRRPLTEGRAAFRSLLQKDYKPRRPAAPRPAETPAGTMLNRIA